MTSTAMPAPDNVRFLAVWDRRCAVGLGRLDVDGAPAALCDTGRERLIGAVSVRGLPHDKQKRSAGPRELPQASQNDM